MGHSFNDSSCFGLTFAFNEHTAAFDFNQSLCNAPVANGIIPGTNSGNR